MRRNTLIMFTLISLLLVFTSVNVLALNSSFFAETFGVGKSELAYFDKRDVDDEDLATILYLYANANRTLTKEQFEFILSEEYKWSELAVKLGMPPFMFEDEVLKFRRMYTGGDRLETKVQSKRFGADNAKDSDRPFGVNERIKYNNDQFSSIYSNRKIMQSERIDVSKNWYKFRYKDAIATEMLTISRMTGKYEYHYMNSDTGEEIKLMGRAVSIDADELYSNLKASGLKFDTDLDI